MKNMQLMIFDISIKLKIKFILYLRVSLSTYNPTAYVIFHSTLRFILVKFSSDSTIYEKRLENCTIEKVNDAEISRTDHFLEHFQRLNLSLWPFSAKPSNFQQKSAQSLAHLVRCYIFCGDLRYFKYKYV